MNSKLTKQEGDKVRVLVSKFGGITKFLEIINDVTGGQAKNQ